MYLKRSDENLERIGPGTAMGELLRRFWLPALLASEVAAAPTALVSAQLLGADLEFNRNLAEPAFADRASGSSYPAVVHDGVIWAFLGHLDFVPTPPDLGGSVVPRMHAATKRLVEHNWVNVLEDTIHGETPFLPPFYTSAFACVPASDTETWVWTFGELRIADRFNDGVADIRRLMIRLARMNARGHFPMAALHGEWYRVGPASLSRARVTAVKRFSRR